VVYGEDRSRQFEIQSDSRSFKDELQLRGKSSETVSSDLRAELFDYAHVRQYLNIAHMLSLMFYSESGGCLIARSLRDERVLALSHGMELTL
jgi:hypothetical protein